MTFIVADFAFDFHPEDTVKSGKISQGRRITSGSASPIEFYKEQGVNSNQLSFAFGSE